ncbi:helix-turn-helix transcriptional regulator [Bdellovibrio bacteriovorus]|uniref:helix-turn-helix domain-containing protein n=1 Tax=Bdellovibrio bacteriovorus TaxID=959 RepID=UPI0021D2EE79|nr:helix-turn-helix transcriptional regulator [Bdellovibrio bacteriovorus]UXR63778.1 helix-turn-helix transcriptional regulator [Bdellovibrio bacteriovorus]
MNLKYLAENDLMYMYFEMNVPNTQTRTEHPEVFKFVAKADKSTVVGYEIENAASNLKYILTSLNLNSKQKLAICLYFIREREGKTQKDFSSALGISESTYKSLERADHNISFDTLDGIFGKFAHEPIMETVFHHAG